MYRADAIAATARTARAKLTRSATTSRRWSAPIRAATTGVGVPPDPAAYFPRDTSRPIMGRVTTPATMIAEIARRAPTVNAAPKFEPIQSPNARIRVPVVPVEERPGGDGEQGVDEDDIHESAPAKLRHERRPRWPECSGARLHEHHHHEQGADPDDPCDDVHDPEDDHGCIDRQHRSSSPERG